MPHEQGPNSPDAQARAKGRGPGTKIWKTRHRELDLHGLGDQTILGLPWLALICSVQCPGSIVIKTLDAIRELRDAAVAVVGGFHSPMEKVCLDVLLRGDQPIVICAAKRLGASRLTSPYREALAIRRLLLISTFEDRARRATQELAQVRNEVIAKLATAVLVPHAAPGGKVEATANNVAKRAQPLFTFCDENNANLLGIGARPYRIADVLGLTRAGSAVFPPGPRRMQ
jgi:hypothetical protein